MNEPNIRKRTSWKSVEKFFAVMGFLAATAALIGLYYQVRTKKAKAEFQILSNDYLTTSNNIDGLNSNYEYRGIPVKNLWLLKFKIINNGDVTLMGRGRNISIIDSTIKFKFDSKIFILDKIELLQKDFPHNLSRLDSVTLSLSFEQWRKNEGATYSIYISSLQKDITIYPSLDRVIIDGDFNVVDFTKNRSKPKGPLLDQLLDRPISFIARILGGILVILVLIFVTWLMIFQEFLGWLKIVKWKKRNKKQFRDFIENGVIFKTEIKASEGEITEIDGKELYQNDIHIIEAIRNNKEEYIKSPENIPTYSGVWKFYSGKPAPYNDGGTTTLQGALVILFIYFAIVLAAVSIGLGLWIS